MKVYEAFQQGEWEWTMGAPTQGDVITFGDELKYFLSISGYPSLATLHTMGHPHGTKCGAKAWDGTAPQGVVAFGEEGSTARYAEGFPHMGIKQGRPVFQGGCTVLRRGLVVKANFGATMRVVQWRDGRCFFLQQISGGDLPSGVILTKVEEGGAGEEQ